jgi:hypothetical protein
VTRATLVRWRGKVRGSWHPHDRTYTKRVHAGHFAVAFQGWGIQAEIVRWLAQQGCERVALEYVRRDVSLSYHLASFRDYMANGIEAVLNPDDGKQVFLPARFFSPVLIPDVPAPPVIAGGGG